MLWLDPEYSQVPRTGDIQKMGLVVITYQTADRLRKRVTLREAG